jgi:Rnl2 family RNA ligase
MEFKKYDTIENTYNRKFVEAAKKAVEKASKKTAKNPLILPPLWILTEKAHGANFSIHYLKETGEIRFARRNGFLKEGERFCQYETIAEELKENMKKLADHYHWEYPFQKYTILSVFGEIMGGGYADMEIPKGIKRIQKGVDYCDKIKFMAFDIRVDDEFVDDEVAYIVLSGRCNFFTAPVIGYYNSLDEALAHSPVFKSVIPTSLKLSEHPDANEAEGFVIRPRKEIRTSKGFRVIFKKKNPKFGEVCRDNKGDSGKPKGEDFHVGDFINKNRYSSVCSKLQDGASTKEIASEFGKDVLEDYKKEYPYEDYGERKKKKIRGQIGKEVWVYLQKK